MKNKNKKTIMLVAMLGLGMAFSSCASKADKEQEAEKNLENVKEEAREDIRDAKEELRKAREEYVKDTQKKIDDNTSEIDKMEAKAKELTGEAKNKADKAIADIKQKNAELKQKLDKNAEIADEKWENFKAEFSKDMDDLGTSIANVFRKDNK